MKYDNRVTGDIAESKFVTYCLQNNIEICKPICNGLQYDFVVKIRDKFKKVQIKSRSLCDGKISDITKYKMQNNRKKPLIDYTKDGIIDLYIVYCPETDLFYNIPLDELKDQRTLTLRVNNTKNNQTSGVRYAKNYELKLN